MTDQLTASRLPAIGDGSEGALRARDLTVVDDVGVLHAHGR